MEHKKAFNCYQILANCYNKFRKENPKFEEQMDSYFNRCVSPDWWGNPSHNKEVDVLREYCCCHHCNNCIFYCEYFCVLKRKDIFDWKLFVKDVVERVHILEGTVK